MKPTEHEGTLAVDAAAQAHWAGYRAVQAEAGAEVPAWEDLDPQSKYVVRNAVLPTVWAALEALPDRLDGLEREWGRRIKDDSMGNGHMRGHVSSLYRTREDAVDNEKGGMFADQELVVRRVTDWEADGE